MNANNLDVESFDSEIAAPQRTSILAILSLVCSLICLIPGTGVLAAIFGISALIGIKGSRGRVGGTGLAIAGLIVGLLFTMIWVGLAIGATKMMQGFTSQFTGPMNQSIVALDTGDASRVRGMLTPEANAAITDQHINDFRAAYQAELGSFKGVPTDMIEFFSAYGTVAPMMQNLQGRQNLMPVPGNFDKGAALLVLVMDNTRQPTQGPDGNINFPISNIVIYTASGKKFSIAPFADGLNSGAPSDPALPPPPETPAAPADAPAEKPADPPAKPSDK
ncbi:MAG: DUF4190 domain-containing protein [Phycisphaerales bacterium]|jgi:hypothetical protein|nr:DUF4190 domain-containing protein [Phycisphaerales bacterium]